MTNQPEKVFLEKLKTSYLFSVKKYQLINIDKSVEGLTEFISVLTSWLYWLINFQQTVYLIL